ncbi:TetR family transcriptional regulator C-terminal domain-containing protein [Paraburkholderia fungorum]|uniref:TetR/AcrR family transcriptional regulator n=1 Tax=Paraburkholderia fungorum TaxID=134537 RepID=UPI0038BD1C75
MAKPSHKDTLIAQGLRVVHERGYNGASVRDIVQAAGVPHGSFTNHFVSKEAFGLEVIEVYLSEVRGTLLQTLCNDELAPMLRLRKYIDINIKHASQNDSRNGCLFGNFALEANESEAIRLRINEIFSEVQRCVAYCLSAAVEAGELRSGTNCDGLASFIVSSLQGAYLMAKSQRNPAPLVNLKEILCSVVLK